MTPYSGKQGHQLLPKMKKQLKRTLPKDIKSMITYKSTKLSTEFLVKDKTDFKYNFFYSKCPNEGYKDDYIQDGHIVEKIIDHNTRH